MIIYQNRAKCINKHIIVLNTRNIYQSVKTTREKSEYSKCKRFVSTKLPKFSTGFLLRFKLSWKNLLIVQRICTMQSYKGTTKILVTSTSLTTQHETGTSLRNTSTHWIGLIQKVNKLNDFIFLLYRLFSKVLFKGGSRH